MRRLIKLGSSVNALNVHILIKFHICKVIFQWLKYIFGLLFCSHFLKQEKTAAEGTRDPSEEKEEE